MMIVSKRAEIPLLKALKASWENSPTQRCLYLRLSQSSLKADEWVNDLVLALRHIDELDFSQIYICHDGDVFILCRSMTRKRLEQFLTHLAPKLEPVPLAGLASLFEIGIDWWRLRTLCEKKIERLKETQNSAESTPAAAHSPGVKIPPLFAQIDRDLISSLAMRREARIAPEIMVVEDDAFSRKLVGTVLEDHYSCTLIADGAGAIYTYVNKAPDILFLDINLPDISGHDVLRTIFKIDPAAYVVMFSGNGDRETVMRSIELGAKGFVGKPFTQDKLLQYIAKSPFIQSKEKKELPHGDTIR